MKTLQYRSYGGYDRVSADEKASAAPFGDTGYTLDIGHGVVHSSSRAAVDDKTLVSAPPAFFDSRFGICVVFDSRQFYY